MAKRVTVPDTFCEADFISAFKSTPTSMAREPPSEEVTIETKPSPRSSESEKAQTSKRSLVETYLTTFGYEGNDSFSARDGKSINVRSEHHRKIREITQSFYNGRISISAYIDNILTDHFKRFEVELKELDRQHPRF